VFIGLPLAVLVFYVAIVRYQFAQIDELTRGLEEKVRARTRALEQAQTRLVQSEKMGSLGRLVAGVAHEVNNPMGAIVGMQQTLSTTTVRMQDALRQVPADVEGRGRLEQLIRVAEDASRVIGDGSSRVRTVVNRLRSFARLDEADVQDADISEGVRETAELLRPRLSAGTELVLQLDALPSMRCNIRALNQVWFDLLANAADALPERDGVIVVRSFAEPDELVVRVQDNGRGMSPREVAAALDPGYTTKGVGVGMGLGLAICYQIVEDHGGSIELDSKAGAGTVVTVRFKRQRAVASTARPALASAV
jgi:signal transduction histidine kinase